MRWPRAPFTSLSSPVLHNNLTIERNLIDGKGPAAYYYLTVINQHLDL